MVFDRLYVYMVLLSLVFQCYFIVFDRKLIRQHILKLVYFIFSDRCPFVL